GATDSYTRDVGHHQLGRSADLRDDDGQTARLRFEGRVAPGVGHARKELDVARSDGARQVLALEEPRERDGKARELLRELLAVRAVADHDQLYMRVPSREGAERRGGQSEVLLATQAADVHEPHDSWIVRQAVTVEASSDSSVR